MGLRTVPLVVLLGLMLITVPVMAAPAASSGPIDQVLTIVKDIQTKVNTLLTDLGAVATDVTTIKSTTDTINDKLTTPPKPIRYEYYTCPIEWPPQTVYALVKTFNWGDTPAYVSIEPVRKYGFTGDWEAAPPITGTIDSWDRLTAPVFVIPNTDGFMVKITTDSPYVAIDVAFGYQDGSIYKDYQTGDFLKVEVYS